MTTNLQDSRLRAADLFALLILSAVSVFGINPYVYGKFNHEITIPFLKHIVDPNLYPNDYLIAELQYFYTYFLSGLAFLVNTFHLTIPGLFFGFYCIALYFTFIGFFKISLTLFRQKEVAYFTIFLLMFAFDTLGEVRTVESMFLERTLTLPILLFAIYFYLKEKYYHSYILQGVAFLIHPLSAMYVIGFLFVSSLIRFKEIGIQKLIFCLVTLVLFAAPSVALKFEHPAPSLHTFHADPEWLVLMRLRSSHHLFPFEWKWQSFAVTFLFLVGFAFTWKHRPASAVHHKIILISSATILLMGVAGTLFSEIFPISIVLQFQLFRSFKFLIYFGILYYANYFYRESENTGNILQKIAVALLLAGIYYGDNLPKFASFLALVFVIFPGYNFLKAKNISLVKYFVPGVIVMLIGIGLAASFLGKDLSFHRNFTIQSSANEDWVATQKWAKAHTHVNDAFIVPPNWTGFRIESERSIYGDWKDGTQMFFNPDFGLEWIRRMKMLGFEDDNRLEQTFKQMQEEDFEKIAAELKVSYDNAYLVMLTDREKLNFQEVYSNKKFTVYKVN